MGIERKLAIAAARNGGAAIGQLTDAEPQPYGHYWNKYGDRFWLPQDEFSMVQYKRDGLMLSRPSRVVKRAEASTDPLILATQQDWEDPNLKRDAGGAVIPTATYYTAVGTAFKGLVDPDSLVKYLAAGMSLDPPGTSSVSSPSPEEEKKEPVKSAAPRRAHRSTK